MQHLLGSNEMHAKVSVVWAEFTTDNRSPDVNIELVAKWLVAPE